MIEYKLFHEIPKGADFHSAIMTTYSFDFYHFESQVLKTLKAKGITNISVFADTTMLDQSIGFATSHLKSLSTSYSVCGVPCKGAFHPKIIILAGEEDVMLIQGSGNITSGGHGKNHELFNVFYANKEDDTQLPLIQEAWLYLKELTKNVNGIAKEKLNWVSSNCNLLNKNIKEKHLFYTISESFRAALLYNSDSGIFNQLSQLIRLDRATEIIVYSPFYDEKGSLLNKFIEVNNSVAIKVFLQLERGIHPFKMEQGKNVQFYSWESTTRAKKRITKIQNRKLHSKVFYFVIEEEIYLLIGSPNATISAFGGENYRGVNDEFAVLIHLKDKTVLEELGLTGVYEKAKPQDNKQIVLAEDEIEEEQKGNQRKVKLLGVDNNRGDLIVFISNSTLHKKAILVVYDHLGELLEEHNISLLKNKIEIKLDKKNNTNTSGYVQFLDEENRVISNKQVINNLQNLWNTNPSVENRKLMKLTSLLETGSNRVFDVINFFNDIKSNRKSRIKEVTNNSSEVVKVEHSPSNMTYEEAIAFNKENQENKEFLSQHNSIKVWDAIEKHFRDLTLNESEGDMDDEEGGKVIVSRERKDKKERNLPIEQRSVNVLEKNRKKISNFFDNYITTLKKINTSESYEIGIVDYATLLIVLNHLMQYSGRKVILKNETEVDNLNLEMLPTLGSLAQVDNFSGALLTILGAFVNVFSKASFKIYDDDYNKKKAIHYKQLLKNNMLFCLSIFKQCYNEHCKGKLWGDVLAYNILNTFGKLDVDYASSLSEFYKDISISKINEITSLEAISQWQLKYETNYKSDDFHDCESLGLCLVNKFLPSVDNKKFIKLVRPGFDFDVEEKDFVLKELYHIDTGKLLKSKQQYQKNKNK